MSTLVQAMRMALHVGETRLGVTDIFGEDVGQPLGGVLHRDVQGLKTAWNLPLDERGSSARRSASWRGRGRLRVRSSSAITRSTRSIS